MRRIIDLYVYSNCDYFIYLDAKSNSYTMFGKNNSGTPLPPEICTDYSTELVKYAEAYVVPEDYEKVVREMQIDRILDVLEHQEVHSFFCGVIDPVRGYTRKCLEYRYYDRNAKLILLSRTDVTSTYMERQKYLSELKAALKKAQTDPLTGLYNYQGIFDNVSNLLEKSRMKAALLFLDLDNFKTVNDSFGHQVGDNLLCEVAQVLRESTDDNDYIGRIGGDEFIIFIPHIKSENKAINCAKMICREINQLSISEKGYQGISCSIGIAISPREGTDYKSLVKVADELSYKSKKAGKNGYSINKINK